MGIDFFTQNIIGSASYIVRKVCSVRERERERERRKWRQHGRAKIGDHDDDEFCTFPCQKIAPLVLAKSFALSLPKLCTSVSPLLSGAEFTLSVAKNVALFETVRILREIRTVKWRDRGSKHRNKWSNFRLHRPSHLKNESN